MMPPHRWGLHQRFCPGLVGRVDLGDGILCLIVGAGEDLHLFTVRAGLRLLDHQQGNGNEHNHQHQQDEILEPFHAFTS